MQAGTLNCRIRIERFVTTRDALNEPIETWGLLTFAWADKRDISDGERFSGGELQAEITTRFRVHWRKLLADLDARDRIVYAGHVYEIVGVKEIDRRVGLEITAARRGDVERA